MAKKKSKKNLAKGKKLPSVKMLKGGGGYLPIPFKTIIVTGY
jgi:hypothetical protein